MSNQRPTVRKKRIAAALAALAIAFGGVAVSAPPAAAAPRASASAVWTYHAGVHIYPQCVVTGQQHRLYHASRGYRSSFQCLFVGGTYPFFLYLLRVHVVV
ncbi:hypothetical protein [Streptomyces sp. NPDC048057]|uniref:hypothetical protein n=1 Tax=Streptomyces sp. NPDC048057 TaxID=3155628 RepID=UPI0033D52D71